MINGRVRDAEVTEASINEAREQYRAAAIRGSILYFVVADLAVISNMYQYSLTYFTSFFNKCLHDSTPCDNVAERVQNIIKYATIAIANNVQRGLLAQHRLVFSYLLTTSIMRHVDTGPAIASQVRT
jgi:dynein heavy chain, axonemal